MKITLTCAQLKYVNYLTFLFVKIMSPKKKDGISCLLFDDYLHSWCVVYVTIKRNIFAKFFKNSATYQKNNVYDPQTTLVYQHLPMMVY